ncbi:hypothetical protein [Campylobacter hominis]|uniref:hypothetical protein n=1 Tax=Campylobacter hominis TaxID=76517 RepID=UPI00248B8D71|nr:hypothetical protein [Campylobacter hominis]
MKKIILALCLVFGVCFAGKTDELFNKCHEYDDGNSCLEIARIILEQQEIDKSRYFMLLISLSHGCDINNGRCCGVLANILEGSKEYKKAKENYGKCCRLEGNEMCCDRYKRLKNQGY